MLIGSAGLLGAGRWDHRLGGRRRRGLRDSEPDCGVSRGRSHARSRRHRGPRDSRPPAPRGDAAARDARPGEFCLSIVMFRWFGGGEGGGGRGKRCGVGGLVCLCVRAFCVYLGSGLPLVVVIVCALVHPGRGARGQEGVGGQKGPAVEVRV